MVFVTQKDFGGLGEGIESLGGSLGRVLGQRQAVKEAGAQRARSGSLIQEAIEKAAMDPVTGERRELNPMELISALTQAQSSGAFPEDIQKYGALYSTLRKQAQQPSFFQKEFQKGIAKQIIDTTQEAGKLAAAESNLDAIEQLIPQVSGPVGYFPTGAAKELDARGLAAIEPVIKIFNPRGVIPQQKIEMVKSLFAPKSSDLVTTIEAKLKALRSFNDKAQGHAQNFLDLVNQYGENIPLQELTNYEKESNKIIDEAITEYRSPKGDVEVKKEVEMKSMPMASQHKGKLIRNTQSGKRYKSDGKRWKEVK